MCRLAMPILLNADRTVIDQRKFTDYVLNATHPRGRDKARCSRRSLATPAPIPRRLTCPSSTHRQPDRPDLACSIETLKFAQFRRQSPRDVRRRFQAPHRQD
jgi:hypothetical protein